MIYELNILARKYKGIIRGQLAFVTDRVGAVTRRSREYKSMKDA